MSGDVKMEPCPFCGGPADIEEIAPKDAGGRNVSFSAGCRNMDGPDECIGQQSLLTFARKSDAAKAWNRRSSSAAERAVVEARREALEEAADNLDDYALSIRDAARDPRNSSKYMDEQDRVADIVDSCIERLRALSSIRGEGGDTQARPSGSAPSSTDTKGTTK